MRTPRNLFFREEKAEEPPSHYEAAGDTEELVKVPRGMYVCGSGTPTVTLLCVRTFYVCLRYPKVSFCGFCYIWIRGV